MLSGMETMRWTADQIPDQTGRTFLITGANSGLGYAMTRELARRGGRVIMAVRSASKGEQALARISGEQPGAPVELRTLDLSDLDSVRTFAAQFDEPLDVLVNNAGVMMPPRQLSPQGHEIQFATNHLGHFALTGLLLDRLRTDHDARVVTLSSGMHKQGHIHFDDLTGARKYSPTAFYAQSKYANVLFGLELDRRLRAAGVPIRSLLAHPGYAATNLQSSGPTGLANATMRLGNRLFAQSAEAGTLPQLYAATAPEALGGEFIGPDRMREMRGYPTVVQPIASATDPELARRFWELSEELTGVTYRLPDGANRP
jgi:NAD(P)-dependent dehydrogenase (short-subunit alcohol dehydrogenase family)